VEADDGEVDWRRGGRAALQLHEGEEEAEVVSELRLVVSETSDGAAVGG
jgi:hypothetical protein